MFLGVIYITIGCICAFLYFLIDVTISYSLSEAPIDWITLLAVGLFWPAFVILILYCFIADWCRTIFKIKKKR